MSRDFAISTGSHQLKIGNTRTGSASFTVSNNTGNTIETRSRISVIEGCKESWLSIEGEKERNYTEKDTQQYTVKCEIPPDVKPGSYRFRLDIFDVENPDEIYSEGPVVEIEVTEGEVKKPGAPFPWWIVAVVLIVLVIGGGITWWATHRSTTVIVTNVMNKTEDEATQMLSENKFKVERKDVLTIKANEIGRVVDQNPPADSEAKPRSKVTLDIGKAGTKVPTTVGSTMEQAINKMNRAGLAYRILVGVELKSKIKEYRISVRKNAAAAARTPAPSPSPSPTSHFAFAQPMHVLLIKPQIPHVLETTPSANELIEKDGVVTIIMAEKKLSRYQPLKKAEVATMGVSKLHTSKMVE